MSDPDCLTGAPPESVSFIDYRTIEWSHVRRTHFWIHQKFHYEYPGPIRELRQRLVVIPADQHGRQQLRDYQLRVSAPTAASSYEIDSFGNRVFRYLIPEIDSDVDFDVWSCIEHDTRVGAPPQVSARAAQRYLRATALTQCDERLADAARDLASQSDKPADLAQRINQWTYDALSYEWGVTHVGTTAPEALAFGRGVCQDYAHIMLALCRQAGLPARYVSGHLLGEGGSHAWVEALLPNEQNGDYLAVAYDPTNNCLVGPSYITIAVGRDFQDVSPCTGTFIAPFQGNLTVTKRAGLTAVEFVD